MDIIKNLKEYKKNLIEVFQYSDTDILDIVIILFILLNPWLLAAPLLVPLFFKIIALLGVLTLFIGIINNHLSFKYWGNLILFLFISTLLLKCLFIWCLDSNTLLYFMEFMMILYSLLRGRKQLIK